MSGPKAPAQPSADDLECARDLTRRIIAWPDDPSSGHDGIKVHGEVANERAPLIAAALAAARTQGIAQGRAEMRDQCEQVIREMTKYGHATMGRSIIARIRRSLPATVGCEAAP